MPSPLSPFGVVLLGMHRSGTSALGRMLAELGLSPGAPDELLGATPANPRGHFEPARLVQANEQVLWAIDRYWHAPATDVEVYAGQRFDTVRSQVRDAFATALPEHGWLYKDPRLCVMWSLYEALFPLPPVALFIARSPLEVASSLARRDRMSPPHALALWEFYNRHAINRLTSFAASAAFTHQQLLQQPDAVAREVAGTLAQAGMEVDPDDVGRATATVEQALARSWADDVDAEPTPTQQQLWDQIQAMVWEGRITSVDPPGAALRSIIDRRAELVNANIRALRFGWLGPTDDLHEPD